MKMIKISCLLLTTSLPVLKGSNPFATTLQQGDSDVETDDEAKLAADTQTMNLGSNGIAGYGQPHQYSALTPMGGHEMDEEPNVLTNGGSLRRSRSNVYAENNPSLRTQVPVEQFSSMDEFDVVIQDRLVQDEFADEKFEAPFDDIDEDFGASGDEMGLSNGQTTYAALTDEHESTRATPGLANLGDATRHTNTQNFAAASSMIIQSVEEPEDDDREQLLTQSTFMVPNASGDFPSVLENHGDLLTEEQVAAMTTSGNFLAGTAHGMNAQSMLMDLNRDTERFAEQATKENSGFTVMLMDILADSKHRATNVKEMQAAFERFLIAASGMENLTTKQMFVLKRLEAETTFHSESLKNTEELAQNIQKYRLRRETIDQTFETKFEELRQIALKLLEQENQME